VPKLLKEIAKRFSSEGLERNCDAMLIDWPIAGVLVQRLAGFIGRDIRVVDPAVGDHSLLDLACRNGLHQWRARLLAGDPDDFRLMGFVEGLLTEAARLLAGQRIVTASGREWNPLDGVPFDEFVACEPFHQEPRSLDPDEEAVILLALHTVTLDAKAWALLVRARAAWAHDPGI